MTAPPNDLKCLQEWFGRIISSPLSSDSQIQEIAPSGHSIITDAASYITPSATLLPHQRIEVYNQQYWWRLCYVLRDNFPLLLRLFGTHDFNQILAVPYLLKYPPNHWSLAILGSTLPQWIIEDYHEKDKSLIYDVACLDWGFVLAFLGLQSERLNLSALILEHQEKITECRFFLQPSLSLFEWDYDLFDFRKAFLAQEPDYWIENPFPVLKREEKYYFVLFRTIRNTLSWKKITRAEWLLLRCFEKGSSLDEACLYIEGLDEKTYDEVDESLQNWLQEWTQLGWLTLDKP